jgi:hypothetical protein
MMRTWRTAAALDDTRVLYVDGGDESSTDPSQVDIKLSTNQEHTKNMSNGNYSFPVTFENGTIVNATNMDVANEFAINSL